MKIASSQPGLPIRTFGKPAATEKQPWQMDQFELQETVRDADRHVVNLRAQVARNQTTAAVGLGVMITSLGVMAAQSALSGGLSATQMIPLAAGAATGITLLSVSCYKRDTAEMEISGARFNSQLLQSIYDKRFP